MKKISTLIGLTAAFASLAAMSNAAIVSFQSAVGAANVTGATNAIGLDFTVGALGISVTDLGYYDSNGAALIGNERISIWKINTANHALSTLVLQGTIMAGTGTLNGGYRFISTGGISLGAGEYSVISENVDSTNTVSNLVDGYYDNRTTVTASSATFTGSPGALSFNGHWRWYQNGNASAPGIFIDSTTVANPAGFFEGNGNANSATGVGFNAGTFGYVPMPEPGTYTMLAGLIVTGAGFAFRLRRKTK